MLQNYLYDVNTRNVVACETNRESVSSLKPEVKKKQEEEDIKRLIR